MNLPANRILPVLIASALLVNLSGLFVPLMDPDAGNYASISKNMLLNHDYVNLIYQDADWLDKPHFPFWIAALSFKIFGVHDWAYKLPALVFMLMAGIYTWLMARRYYDEATAGWSVLVLFTSLHIVVSNTDVRAEPYLTGLLIAALYHFARAAEGRWPAHLLMACIYTACAVMAKGIFTLIPIGGAIVGHLLLKRLWKQLFHLKWLLAMILVAVFCLPELYCLWLQFDLHPEKEVFGTTGVSGIRFFLWDSQFGRFFNTGPIRGTGNKFFFLHTLLWAFLPWALLMYASLYKHFKALFFKNAEEVKEWFCFSGSLISLLLFSFSGFQLPHYTNIIFPFLAIISAHYIQEMIASQNRFWSWVQYLSAGLIPLSLVLLFFVFQPGLSAAAVICAVPLLLGVYWFKKQKDSLTAYHWSALSLMSAALFLNLVFYPALLQYQSGNLAAFYLNQNDPGAPLGRIANYFPSGEFYLQGHTYRTGMDSVIRGSFKKARYLFINEAEKRELENAKVDFTLIREYEAFHITKLNLRFINKASRKEAVEHDYLVQLR